MSDLLIYIYFGISSIVFLIYGLDKFKAIRKEWRIPEKHLLLYALIGPLGALLGMVLLRHKIRKTKFVFFVPFMLLVHIALVVLYWIKFSPTGL